MALSAKDWATECARQELKIQTLQAELDATNIALKASGAGYEKMVQRLNHWADNCECQCHECHQLANAIPRS